MQVSSPISPDYPRVVLFPPPAKRYATEKCKMNLQQGEVEARGGERRRKRGSMSRRSSRCEHNSIIIARRPRRSDLETEEVRFILNKYDLLCLALRENPALSERAISVKDYATRQTPSLHSTRRGRRGRRERG